MEETKKRNPVEILESFSLEEQLLVLKEISEISATGLKGENIYKATKRIEDEIQLGQGCDVWQDTVIKIIPLILALRFAPMSLIEEKRPCVEIRIEQCVRNPFFSKRDNEEEHIGNLMISILKDGLQSPILVMKNPNNDEEFIVADGYYRMMAYKDLGHNFIAAYEEDYSETKLQKFKENQ